jgi:hypothetical protein
LERGFSDLCFAIGPLAFLAAALAHRIQTGKQVGWIALFGMALPLGATLFAARVIAVATRSSRFYTPSLPPDVGMALWGGASRRYEPVWLLVVAVTTFGAARFAIRELTASASMLVSGTRQRRVLLLVLIGAIAWLSRRTDPSTPPMATEIAAASLSAAAAVLTTDFLMAKWAAPRIRKVDWTGTFAVVAGGAMPFYLRNWTPDA